MKKEILQLPELTLIGISDRTNNKNETAPETAKILPIVQRYFHKMLADKISNRAKPFFEKMSYFVVKERNKLRPGGITLTISYGETA